MFSVIVACGPESNGTKLLSRILSTSGEKVVHRSLPNGTDWWHYSEFPKDTTFVAIFRSIDHAVESVLAAGHVQEFYDKGKRHRAREEQRVARASLSEIPGLVAVTYEGLVQDPEGTVSALARRLGLSLRIPESIYDGNAKYGKR